jgi:phosphoglycerate dehydrogenase-like enzyme
VTVLRGSGPSPQVRRWHISERSASRPTLVTVSVQGEGTLPGDHVAVLRERADVTFLARSDRMTPEDARFAFRQADVVALTPKVAPRFDEELLRALPRLRGICLYATGYDFLDMRLLERRGIALSVLPDYSTEAVAEHALGMLLSVAGRIHLANDRSRRMVPATTSLRGFELRGRTLGIIGCGRIGSRVAELAQAVGMRTIAHDIDPKPVAGVTYVERGELLAASDAVSLHCPMLFGAPPMIDAHALAVMRPGAVLINSSRAALVDDDAVVSSIRDGHLRGYAVDDELLDAPELEDLRREGRLLQTGHSAWWSDETLARGAVMWGEHIQAMLDGVPVHVVDDAAVLTGRVPTRSSASV